MTEEPFDPEEWITRLGASLEAMTPAARYSISFKSGDSRYIAHEKLRALHEAARYDPALRDTLASSRAQLKSDPTEQQAILRDHPLWRRALKGSGKDEGLTVLSPDLQFHISSKSLVSGLVRQSAVSSGAEAARLLDRYLTDGEARLLEAREFIVIYGLKLAARIELDDGAFLAPLDDRLIEEEGFTAEEADKLRTLGIAGRNFQDGSGGSAVFVRDLDWGPGVVPASDGPDIDHATCKYRFPFDIETVTDLLSVASHCPLAISTRHVRVAKWIRDIEPNLTFGSWGGRGYRSEGWWKESDLSGDAEASFRKAIAGWAAFQFGSEYEHDALNLALRRLSGSFARIGRMQLQDRILDYAIVLEILYRLDRSELTYKLATRAGHLLGRTPQERIAIFEKVTEFYDTRSAIVHGPSNKKQRKLGYEDFERACAEGRDLACSSLSELLLQGRFPDWKRLIFDGPAAPATLPSPSAAYQGDC